MVRIFQKKYSTLELSKLHLFRENMISLIIFYLQGSSISYAKLAINFKKTKHIWTSNEQLWIACSTKHVNIEKTCIISLSILILFKKTDVEH